MIGFWTVPLVVLITHIHLTGFPALTSVSSAFCNAVFPIGMAYALGGRPFQNSPRPNLHPWIWALLLAALTIATAAFFVLRDANAFAWAPVLAAIIPLPCWLMPRVRSAMQLFGVGEGWWPSPNRKGQWLP